MEHPIFTLRCSAFFAGCILAELYPNLNVNESIKTGFSDGIISEEEYKWIWLDWYPS